MTPGYMGATPQAGPTCYRDPHAHPVPVRSSGEPDFRLCCSVSDGRTTRREIKILKNLKHDNIVRLKEIVTSKAGDHNKQTGSVFMVFEYAEHDLAGLILNQRIRLENQHVKSYLKQLLDGLHYLHKQKILWDNIHHLPHQSPACPLLLTSLLRRAAVHECVCILTCVHIRTQTHMYAMRKGLDAGGMI